MTRKRIRGFTLMEMVIVVVIVGILAAIAYPSYLNQLRKGRRGSAETHLMDIAARQQQYLLDNREYAVDLPTLSMTTPADVSTYYTITVTPNNLATPPTFTAQAAPFGSQAGDPAGTLTVDNTGAKTASGGAGFW
jgi:type IV pilus assembly protein PilE